MRRIIFIGYMGAGKTTIGRQMAKCNGLQFYDLDWYIETRMRKKIPQIFEERGEDGFRKIEHNMLHEVAEFEDVVISCGGGTPCFFDNMEYMNAQAETIYLKASPDIICSHLKMSLNERPLLRGKSDDEMLAFVRQQMAQRETFYSKAKHTFSVDVLDSRERIRASIEQIQNLLL